MSLFKKLFGGGSKPGEGREGRLLGEEEYSGFIVRALEMKAGSEYQLCGEIVKKSETGEGDPQVHKFIRADRLATDALAKEAALAKGRQIIDEQGKTLFS